MLVRRKSHGVFQFGAAIYSIELIDQNHFKLPGFGYGEQKQNSEFNCT